jgi:IS30 family transposase
MTHKKMTPLEERMIPSRDLIAGSSNSYIDTLIERHSRFVMLAKFESKDTQSFITNLITLARKLPVYTLGSNRTFTAS